MEEAATPFPSEETTPPVTKIYFGAIRAVRGFKARTYGPPQETYKELCTEGEKVSIGDESRRNFSLGMARVWRSGIFCPGEQSFNSRFPAQHTAGKSTRRKAAVGND